MEKGNNCQYKKIFTNYFCYSYATMLPKCCLEYQNTFVINRLAIWKIELQTYINNWPLQPLSQYDGLASHSAHVVCINFIREWRK